jgi:hypothetical protein
MAISANDISVVLSGGSSNTDPNDSIGGDPSNVVVNVGRINNLFDDVTPEEAEAGFDEFRCFYVFNDSDQVITNITIWIVSQTDGGSSLEVGIQDFNEVQRITVGNATGGNIRFSFKDFEFVSEYRSDLGQWASELELSLNSLTDEDGYAVLSGVEIRGQSANNTSIFDLTFSNNDRNRNHESIVIVENNLTPSVSVNVITIQEGAPINTIASKLDFATTTPGGVGFFAPTLQSPINLPYLAPGDGFPVWLKRSTSPNTSSVNLDGATLRIRINALNPNI